MSPRPESSETPTPAKREWGQWVSLSFRRGDMVQCCEPRRKPWRGTVHAIIANNYHTDALSVTYVVIPDNSARLLRRYLAPDRLTLIEAATDAL